ncbi:5,6-dimethylbenzimidazole synthase [Marinobacter sp. CA1]|uniref:5,6-dimethylbenzimidazole synthase n=1 Tax=Marinobacter sp. CA1 TaxID=2817656 RepID=UPI001D0803DC|nr:5,6-dimethylbenzimidazole synthase [Marinobacter sp. CA1]UDL05184.1 5,6-dimethylbenzimidazole synthase [Marinobacter sp. CA1]
MSERCFSTDDQQLLTDILRHRRDVRGNNFRPEPIPEPVLEQILQAATLAPSVGFSQPWEFVQVADPALRAQVAESFDAANRQARERFSGERGELYARLKLEGIHEAPVNLAVFYRASEGPVLGQTAMAEAGEYSVVCAVQNMWLMARALNVGMGWVSILDPRRVAEILQAPADRKLVAYLCLGYVHRFDDRPELERLEWEQRRALATVLHTDGYR